MYSRQQNPLGQGQGSQPTRGYVAAHALTAALSNPYAQVYPQSLPYPQASHYAQAYNAYPGAGPSNAVYGQSATNGQGYTMSSTWDPSRQATIPHPQAASPPTAGRPSRSGGQTQTYWYQPGNCRCAKAGCTFMGSQKAVETHMMDRHLIFPPGWQKRKRNADWDADPSLKGYVHPESNG